MSGDPISHERLLSVLRYDPQSGLFHWVAQPKKGIVVLGHVAGYPSKKNGWIIIVDGRQYYAHRLAWFYVTGEWPKHQIDHKNVDRLDNRWGNLREATYLTNNQNVKLKSHNTTGVKGVSFCKATGRYYTYINAEKKRHFLGYYDSADEAGRVYDEAAKRLHGEFARLNFPEPANG